MQKNIYLNCPSNFLRRLTQTQYGCLMPRQCVIFVLVYCVMLSEANYIIMQT